MEMSGLIDLLAGKGNSLIGSVLSDAEAVAFVKANFPGRAYCLVADWTVIDLSVSDEQAKMLATLGHAASIVYALCVIEDSRGRFLPGDWVKSSYGVSFTHGCLFETQNTVYVLMRGGRRLGANLEFLLSLR